MATTEPVLKPPSLENDTDLTSFRSELLAKIHRDHSRDGSGEMILAGAAVAVGWVISRWGTNVIYYTGMPLIVLGLIVASIFISLWAWKRYITIPRIGWARFAMPKFKDRPAWQRPFLLYQASRDLMTPRPLRPLWARVLLGILNFVAAVALMLLIILAYAKWAPAASGRESLEFESRQFLFQMVLMMAIFPRFSMFPRGYDRPWSLRNCLDAVLGVGLYLTVDLLTQSPAQALVAVGGTFFGLAAFRVRRFLRDYPKLESADAQH